MGGKNDITHFFMGQCWKMLNQLRENFHGVQPRSKAGWFGVVITEKHNRKQAGIKSSKSVFCRILAILSSQKNLELTQSRTDIIV